MTDAAPEAAEPDNEPPGDVAAPPRRRRRWAAWIAKAAITLTASLLLLLGCVALLLDTDLGHRLILDRIAAMTPDSGLRIRIGRLDGSIWGRTELRDVRLYDPEGLFAEAPQVGLEWQPLAWLAGQLSVRSIESDLVIVRRLPRFEGRRGSGLPKNDIHIARLEIAQLRLDEPVAGTRRFARVTGAAEFRSRRALMELEARMRGGGDLLTLMLDAEPDRDRFDLDLNLDAPAGGVFARLLGFDEAFHAEVSGDGSWARWAGGARLRLGTRPAGELRLSAQAGRYGAGGWLAPGLLPERLAALAAPRLDVEASGTLEAGALAGTLAARSPAARLFLQGGADLRRDRWSDLRVGLRFPRETGLADGLTASGLTAAALIDGPFGNATIAYRVSADEVAAGGARLERLQASGSGSLADGRFGAPVVASIGRAAIPAGGGEVALTGLSVGGRIAAAGQRLAARDLVISGDRLRTQLNLQADFATGRYSFAGEGGVGGWPVEDLGQVDLRGTLRGAGDAGGLRLDGRARATVSRLDSALIRWTADGAPQLEATIAAAPGGPVQLPELRLTSPALRLSGSGSIRGDGTLQLDGRGRHTRHGPVSLTVAGPLSAPRLALRLSRPSSIVSDLALEIGPEAQGFAYRGSGDSPLGRFSARGAVAIARGRPAAVRVAALELSGATGAGQLRPRDGGLEGRIDFRGALAGPLLLSMPGGEQRVEAELVASNARLGDLPIGSGRVAAWAQFGAGGTPLSGRIRFDGAADRLWPIAGPGRVELSGPFELDGELGGSLADPELRGTLALRRGRLVSAATGTTLSAVDAEGRFASDRIVIQSLSARTAGGGSVRGSGTIDLLDGTAFSARIEAEEAQLLDLPDMRARASGTVEIRSAPGGGRISGALRLHEAALRLAPRGGGGGGGRSGGGWALDLGIRAERFALSGRGIDSEWRGDVRLGGTLARPAATGEAALLRGTYSVLGARFELSRGRARFDGSADPEIDLVARPPAGLPLGALRITGRLSQPQVAPAPPDMPSPPPATSQGAMPPAAPARPPRRMRKRPQPVWPRALRSAMRARKPASAQLE